MTIVLALIGPAVASAAAAASPGALHLASIDAQREKATWSVSPAVSSDGSRVAFVTISPLDPGTLMRIATST
jgi:hypothetical protein